MNAEQLAQDGLRLEVRQCEDGMVAVRTAKSGWLALKPELACLCESPIEQLFLSGLMLNLRAAGVRYGVGGEKSGTVRIVPQYQWRHYRFDFAVMFLDEAKPVLLIECDGHDFHERTKEQAIIDRAKDREVQAAGGRIFRFTGSEIWNELGNCATEVISVLVKCGLEIAL